MLKKCLNFHNFHYFFLQVNNVKINVVSYTMYQRELVMPCYICHGRRTIYLSTNFRTIFSAS